MIEISQLIDIGLLVTCLYLIWENYKTSQVIDDVCDMINDIADKHNSLAKMCEDHNHD